MITWNIEKGGILIVGKPSFLEADGLKVSIIFIEMRQYWHKGIKFAIKGLDVQTENRESTPMFFKDRFNWF